MIDVCSAVPVPDGSGWHKLAGVDRTTLYRLMDKHGLQRDTVFKVG